MATDNQDSLEMGNLSMECFSVISIGMRGNWRIVSSMDMARRSLGMGSCIRGSLTMGRCMDRGYFSMRMETSMKANSNKTK